MVRYSIATELVAAALMATSVAKTQTVDTGRTYDMAHAPEYNGSDSVSDIMRSLGGAVEKSSAPPRDEGVVDPNYATTLFSTPGDASIAVCVLPQRLCSVCSWFGLFVRGYCPCLVSCICSGDTPIEQLAASGIQPGER